MTLFKNKTLFNLLVFFTFVSFTLPSFATESAVAETHVDYALEVHNVQINHQKSDRTLNLKVWYSQSGEGETPNVESVKNVLMSMVMHYPSFYDEMDYWEIMNKNLTQHIAQSFPSLEKVKIELAVVPDRIIPFHRRSVVSYSVTKGEFVEAFGFKVAKQELNFCGVNTAALNIYFQYIPNPQRSDYPDFRWIGEAVTEFTEQHAAECQDWSAYRSALIEYVKTKYPVIVLLEIEASLL